MFFLFSCKPVSREPWPGRRCSKSRDKRFLREERRLFELEENKSVLPTALLKMVSPEKRVFETGSRKETLPAVWPGVNRTFMESFPKFRASFSLKGEEIFGKMVSPNREE